MPEGPLRASVALSSTTLGQGSEGGGSILPSVYTYPSRKAGGYYDLRGKCYTPHPGRRRRARGEGEASGGERGREATSGKTDQAARPGPPVPDTVIESAIKPQENSVERDGSRN